MTRINDCGGDPEKCYFMFGELTESTKNLTAVVSDLRDDVANLRNDLSDLKMFKSKLIGGALALSTVVSLVVQSLAFHLKK